MKTTNAQGVQDKAPFPTRAFLLSSLALLLIFSLTSAAITSGRLVFLNSSTASLNFDTATATYVDTSLANPNAYVELCADLGTELLGNFTTVYYRSGAINISIGLIPANITSVNASNCTTVDVDTSLYKSFYPGVLSVGISNTSSMSSPLFVDLNETTGLLSGRYEYTDLTNATNTVIHLEKIYYSAPNEITTDKPYLIVSIWNASGFVNSTLVNRSTNAVFPLTSFTIVKVNNLTAFLFVPSGGCTTDAQCGSCQRCTAGNCVAIPGCGASQPEQLYLSVQTDGYFGSPVIFTVTDGGRVHGASVRVSHVQDGYSQQVDSGTTDNNGEYAAIIGMAKSEYFAYASKSGSLRSDDEYFTLQAHTFSLTVANEIYVRTELPVTVYDSDSGVVVEGAQVKLYSPSGGIADTCTTDASGRCVFSSGTLRVPGTYALVATKQFYDDAATPIDVLLYPLQLDYPTSVYARQEFDIQASSLGSPVSGATVKFQDKPPLSTNSQGKVTDLVFTQTGTYTFTATKDDYESYRGSIDVSLPPIIPVYPNETYSKEKFVITVTSPDKDCVTGVDVVIGSDLRLNTSSLGEVAVRVEVPNNYTVVMSKEGCEPFRGIREIPERPPEKPYEKPIIIKKPPKSAAELISDELGLGTLVKSGCSGFYIEGFPVVLCDLLWLVVIATSLAGAYFAKTNMRKALFFFLPILAAIVSLPVIGVVIGAIALSVSYRSWADDRAKSRALKAEADKIGKELASGRSIEEVLKAEASKKPEEKKNGGKPPTNGKGESGKPPAQPSTENKPPAEKKNGNGGGTPGNGKGTPSSQQQK